MSTLCNLTICQNEKALRETRREFVRESGPYSIVDLVGDHFNIIQTNPASQFQGRKVALISGAGIAGLATAFVLIKKGFEVIIAESRKDFSRHNIINLNIEVQDFLSKFDLLEEFECSVAALIENHKTIAIGKNGVQTLESKSVYPSRYLKSLDVKPNNFDHLFNQDGIYSVQIKDLQAFLAQRVAMLGVKILSGSEIKFAETIQDGRVSEVEIIPKDDLTSSITIKPDLVFIAEGAHSFSTKQLGMAVKGNDKVTNVCTGEKWVFGNLDYLGEKTTVVSMVLTAKKTLQIANVIFNAKTHIANVAVTTSSDDSPFETKELIIETAKKAFNSAGIQENEFRLIEKPSQPVIIKNRRASVCSFGNVFRIGDSVGNSSPLAGLGGTLGLTLVPITINRLLKDFEEDNAAIHDNFKEYSQAYVDRWISKSVKVKEQILEFHTSQAGTTESKYSEEKVD